MSNTLRIRIKKADQPYTPPTLTMTLKLIDISALKDGFYILEIKDGEQVSFKELMEAEAGIIASYRVQQLMNQSKTNH